MIHLLADKKLLQTRSPRPLVRNNRLVPYLPMDVGLDLITNRAVGRFSLAYNKNGFRLVNLPIGNRRFSNGKARRESQRKFTTGCNAESTKDQRDTERRRLAIFKFSTHVTDSNGDHHSPGRNHEVTIVNVA